MGSNSYRVRGRNTILKIMLSYIKLYRKYVGGKWYKVKYLGFQYYTTNKPFTDEYRIITKKYKYP